MRVAIFMLLGVAAAGSSDHEVLLQQSIMTETVPESKFAIDFGVEEGFVQVPIEHEDTDEAGAPIPAPEGFDADFIDSPKGRSLAKEGASSRGKRSNAEQAPLFSPAWWMGGGRLNQKQKKKEVAEEQPKFSCKTWAENRKTACVAEANEYLKPSAAFITDGNFSSEHCCVNVGELPKYKVRENHFMPNGNNVPERELKLKGPYSTFMKDWHKTEDGAMLVSIEVAHYICHEAPSCAGFCHEGTWTDAKRKGAVWVYFKTTAKVGQISESAGWTSYVVPKTKNDPIDFIEMQTKDKGRRAWM